MILLRELPVFGEGISIFKPLVGYIPCFRYFLPDIDFVIIVDFVITPYVNFRNTNIRMIRYTFCSWVLNT